MKSECRTSDSGPLSWSFSRGRSDAFMLLMDSDMAISSLSWIGIARRAGVSCLTENTGVVGRFSHSCLGWGC